MDEQNLSDLAFLIGDQCECWEKGSRVRVESYFPRYPQLRTNKQLLLDFIVNEWDLCLEYGQPLDLQDYLQRFPHLGDKLRSLFEVHSYLGGDKGKPSTVPDHNPPAIPGYERLQELGRGGMGIVYKAWQKALNRWVALKLIQFGTLDSQQALKLFRREADALGRLTHPNVVRAYDYGEHNGQPYMAMELVEGGALSDKLRGGPLKPDEGVHLMIQLARGAHAAHTFNLIHRDLKPENILLTADGTPKISDFGLVRHVAAEGLSSPQRSVGGGTLQYMAPEQFFAKDSDKIGPRTDVYALGGILYTMLTRQAPQPDSKLALHRFFSSGPQQTLPALRHAGDRDLEAICLKCLAFAPEQRYASALELAEDLVRYQRREPVSARPVGRVTRGRYWCRRNAAVATLAAVVFVTLVTSLTTISASLVETQHARQAEKERGDELLVARQAEKRRADDLEIALSQSQFQLAYQRWQDGDVVHTNELLDAIRKPELRHIEWYVLKRLSQGVPHALGTQMKDVRAIDLSPDGRRAALAGAADSGKQTVRVLDLRDGSIVFTVSCEEGYPITAWSPDGARLAVANGEGMKALAVWEIDQKKCLWSKKPWQFDVVQQSHLAVCFLDGGRRLLTATREIGDVPMSYGVTFQQWDARNGQLVGAVAGPRSGIGMTAVLSSDGQRLAVLKDGLISLQGEEFVCESQTGTRLHSLKGDARSVAAAFSRDHLCVATAGSDGAVKFWDTESGQAKASLGVFPTVMCAVAFSPDGRLLAAGSTDRLIRIWDVRTRRLLSDLRGHEGTVSALKFLPDGKGLISGGAGGRLMVWSLDPPGVVALREVPGAPLTGILSPDGSRLISAHTGWGNTRSSMIRINDLVRRKTVREISGTFFNLALSPDGERLAGMGPDGAHVWELESGRQLAILPGLAGPLRFDATGKSLIGVDRDRKRSALIVVDVTTGVTCQRLEGEASSIRAFSLSADSKRAAVGYANNTVILWDVTTGKRMHSFAVVHQRALRLVLRPDGRQLLTVCDFDPKAILWDIATGKEQQRLIGHRFVIHDAAYSPDGGRVLTAGEDETVKLWDVKTGHELMTFRDCRHPVRWVAFSADGQHFAAGCNEGISGPGDLVIWDARPLDAK